MSNTDFNTEGEDARFGVRFTLQDANTNTYWYASREKQQTELKKWKKQVGPGEFYVWVSAVKR